METTIRAAGAADAEAVEALYRAAFPDEDLVPLVRRLMGKGSDALSLLAEVQGRPAGHVAFTPCRVRGRKEPVALLGPLAVAPANQRKGIGRQLVRAGLDRLAASGFLLVLVLGDPAYYGRFGFRPDTRIAPPYRLPEDWRGAWQSLALSGAGADVEGDLEVPGAWRDRALWSA